MKDPPNIILAPGESESDWGPSPDGDTKPVYLEQRALWLQAERRVGWDACLRAMEGAAETREQIDQKFCWAKGKTSIWWLVLMRDGEPSKAFHPEHKTIEKVWRDTFSVWRSLYADPEEK